MSISTEDRLNIILLAQQLSSAPSQIVQMISFTNTRVILVKRMIKAIDKKYGYIGEVTSNKIFKVNNSADVINKFHKKITETTSDAVISDDHGNIQYKIDAAKSIFNSIVNQDVIDWQDSIIAQIVKLVKQSAAATAHKEKIAKDFSKKIGNSESIEKNLTKKESIKKADNALIEKKIIEKKAAKKTIDDTIIEKKSANKAIVIEPVPDVKDPFDNMPSMKCAAPASRINYNEMAYMVKGYMMANKQSMDFTDTSTYDKRTNIWQYIKSALGKPDLSFRDSMTVAAHLH